MNKELEGAKGGAVPGGKIHSEACPQFRNSLEPAKALILISF